MANSITLKHTGYGEAENRCIRVLFTQEKDVANNRSKITWTIYSEGTPPSTVTIAETIVKVNGTEVAKIPLTRYSENKFPATVGSTSGSTYVNHNADGTKTISVYLSTNVYYWDVKEYSANWTLDSIPRKATITSVSDFYSNSNPVINYSNPAGNSMAYLTVALSLDGTNAFTSWKPLNKTGTSATVSLTDAEWLTLKNATPNKSRTITYILCSAITTPNYEYDRKTATFTMANDSSNAPSVSTTYSIDNGSAPSDFAGMMIEGISRVKSVTTASGKFNATISSYSATFQGKTYSGANVTTDIVKAGNKIESLKTTATDSRGHSGGDYKSITFYERKNPYVTSAPNRTSIECFRANDSKEADDSSNKVMLRAMGGYTPIVKNGTDLNSAGLSFRTISAAGASGWTNLTLTNGVYDDFLPVTFDPTITYTIELRAYDRLGYSDAIPLDIGTADIPLHLRYGGHGVGIGMYAEETDYLEVGYDTRFHKQPKMGSKGLIPYCERYSNSGTVHLKGGTCFLILAHGNYWGDYAGIYLLYTGVNTAIKTILACQHLNTLSYSNGDLTFSFDSYGGSIDLLYL